MKNYNNTYAFYNDKGQRLSVFCRYLDSENAELFILRCSRKDAFIKKLARNVYLKYVETGVIEKGFHPEIIKVKIQYLEQKRLDILLKYCVENFYSLVETTIEVEETFEHLVKAKYL